MGGGGGQYIGLHLPFIQKVKWMGVSTVTNTILASREY